MQFHYIAYRSDQGVTEGDLEAQNLKEVLENLAGRGLRPVSVKILKQRLTIASFKFWGKGVTLEDKIFLTKYLALMLRVGTNLFEAVEILIEDFEKPALKSFLLQVRSNLEKGQAFYSAFAEHPKLFSDVFINLLKAGEASGTLEKTLEDLSVSLEKEKSLSRQVRSALVYPMLLVVMSFFVVTFLITFVLPRIAASFSNGNIEPPLFSKIVFTVSLFLGDHVLLVYGLLFGGMILLWLFLRHTKVGAALFWRMITRVPIVGTLIKKIAIQRFATTLSSLMRAGISIVDSLEITADVVGNEDLRGVLKRVTRDGITRGLTIGDAFKREPYFPRTVSNLIAISEKAGHLDSILVTLANFYEEDVLATVGILVSIIEPVLLMFIGTVIGGIALAILVPIYQLAGTL